MLALLLALTLPASAAPGPRCPDGKTPPQFSGRPFDPIECPRPGEKPGPAVELSSSSLPSPESPSDLQSLKALAGRWEGYAAYGISRYEVLIVVEKSGKSFKVRVETKDYQTLNKNVLDADVRGRFFGAKGRYDVTVTLESLPKDPREGVLLAGAPLKPEPPYDRELVLVYGGRSDSHRLRLKVDKDVLRWKYDYTFAQPKPGALSSAGELKRSERPSL